MAKITITVCDVKPCTRPAEREFELNGEKIYVCGENCFVKFWSREYNNWKTTPYMLQSYNDQAAQVAFSSCEIVAEQGGGGSGERLLHVLKPN